MSIATEILRLQNAKKDFKTKYKELGVSVADDITLDKYPALMPTGGSGGDTYTIATEAQILALFNK